MKILYLINYAGNGGSEKYVLTIARNLPRTSEVCLAYNIHGPLVAEMEKLGAQVFHISMRHPFDLQAALALSCIIRDNGIDIVHAQYPRENYIAVLSKIFTRKVQIVYTAHWNRADTAMRKFANRLLTKADSAVIAVGTECAEFLRQNGYPASRVRTIFPGTEIGIGGAQPPPTGIDFSDGVFVFTIICRLSEEKGLHFLLESAAELQKRTSGFMLLIAGDGEQRFSLEEHANELRLSECVKFLGYVDGCGGILSKTDCYINSSQNESFGFATIEAMSYSVPVIATDVGGNRDLVNSDTNCGILVPYGDTAKMSDAMWSMMTGTDAYAQYALNAKTAVERLFSVERFVSETVGLYTEIYNKER